MRLALALVLALVAVAAADNFVARFNPGAGTLPPTGYMLRECFPTAMTPCCVGPVENCQPTVDDRWHDKAPGTPAICATLPCTLPFTVTQPPLGFVVTPFFYVDARNDTAVSPPSNARSLTLGVTTTTTRPVATTTTSTLPALGTCASPQVVPPAGGAIPITTSGASLLASNPSTAPCNTSNLAPERVLIWTPPRSGQARIETCSTTATDVDTVLYLRTPATCLSGPDASCVDDVRGCGTTTDTTDPHRGSVLTPTVTAGVPIVIVVDGYNGAHQAGRALLTVTPPPVPVPPMAPGTFTIERVP